MQLLNADTFSAAPGLGMSGTGEAAWASTLPSDAVAHIWKPARSAMTSGRARAKAWRLRIERRRAPWIDPLMGWTSGDDTASQVELSFPSFESAIHHARRLGIAYQVHMPPGMVGNARAASRPARPEPHDSSDAPEMPLAA